MDTADSKWFDEVYLGNYARIKNIALRALGSEAVAEDLAQETFLVFLYRIEEMKRHPNPAGWLVLTVKNQIRNELKRASTQLEVPLEHELAVPGRSPDSPLAELLPAGLTADERQVLIWYFDDQLSYQQIAARLSISEGACRNRVYRAKAHFKALTANQNFL